MGAKSHIAKWGTSLAVRIPKPIAEQWGVHEGSAIEMVSEGDHIVMRKRTYDLADMLALTVNAPLGDVVGAFKSLTMVEYVRGIRAGKKQ